MRLIGEDFCHRQDLRKIENDMTRAEAIKNGTLVDVSRTAVEAGFCMPVALTRMVHDRCVKKDSLRLWDLLVELYEAIDEAPDDGSEEVDNIRTTQSDCEMPSRRQPRSGSNDDARG
jgi:hypothetical protein